MENKSVFRKEALARISSPEQMEDYMQVASPRLWMILSAIIALTNWAKTVYSLKINGKMAIEGNVKYMWKVLRLPMEFFSQRMAGDIMGRQDTNASIAKTLVDTVAPLALNILVMDKGAIIEQGKYEELIAQNGVFADLEARQRLDTGS